MGNRNEKGFTLIELMIVIAIIGVLAAIAFSQYNQYRQRSFRAACESDAHSWANAQEAYFTDHDVYCSDPAILQGAPYRALLSEYNEAVINDSNTTAFSLTILNSKHSVNATWDSDAGGMQ